MPNVTISIDKDTLQAAREYAHRRNTSLNALIRQLLEQHTRRRDETWVDACFVAMDELAVKSAGRRFRREELYDV